MLGSLDDDHYIYLDKDGNASKKLEFTVSWNRSPQIKVLITCDHRSSMEYLAFQIAEAMQMYEFFQGLSGLQAQNIALKGQVLPTEGLIGDWLKSTECLTCDIISTDQWLDVVIDCREFPLLITFQIKVYSNLLIQVLRLSLLQIANQICSSHQQNLLYEPSECELKKVAQFKNKDPILQQVYDLLLVKDTFDYLDSQVYIRTSKPRHSQVTTSSLLDSVQTSKNWSFLVPIRRFSFIRRQRKTHPFIDTDMLEHSKCCCILY